MEDYDRALYAAFQAKDARFDGRFFVGIASTGIYCRPVCRAKKPKAENCTFFETAAAAEQAGFRPCLMCRPELAPGFAQTDASASLARQAARLLEENCGLGLRLPELAARLGCTDRHLRRVFTAEYQVSPVQYLQTCRLLLAKNLLTDTDLSVLAVAMAAGFGSLRRFNDLFQQHYHLSPTALRKKGRLAGQQPNATITIALGYRPPYQWEQLLRFLAKRAIVGIETVVDDAYLRTVRITNGQTQLTGWIRVKHLPDKNRLAVTLSESLLPALSRVLAQVRSMFDLYCDPEAVYATLQTMNELRPGLCVTGTRLPGSFDPFEMAVRAVLGQQITVKAAGTLAARFVAAYGTPIETGIAGLTHVFPTPETFLALPGPIEQHLGPLGVIASRAQTIAALAKALTAGSLDLHLGAPLQEADKLLQIPGIGNWTANYIVMRTLGYPDAFLETDAGVKKALPYPKKELLQLAETWRPWRSYATVNLWHTLEG